MDKITIIDVNTNVCYEEIHYSRFLFYFITGFGAEAACLLVLALSTNVSEKLTVILLIVGVGLSGVAISGETSFNT